MTNEFIHDVIKRTAVFEGFSEIPYRCPAGKITIGFGLNLENPCIAAPVLDLFHQCVRDHVMGGGSIGNEWRGLKMSRKQAKMIMYFDLVDRWEELTENQPWITTLPKIARMVVLDMCYNLGLSRFLKFKRFLKALEQGDWDTAADEMLDSRWAHQVKSRATRQAEEIRGYR